MKKVFLFFALTLYLSAEATIFVYHRFGDSRFPTTNTPLQELRQEFEYLKNNGYEVVSLQTLVDALKNDKPIADNWVVLTIDDSYKSFYRNGLAIFKEYGYPFTLFVQSETALWKTSKEYMNKDEILEAAKLGEIGCHSHKHDYLPTKDAAYVKADTQRCIDIMTGILGYTPKYYAYPYGSYNADVKALIKSFGFEAVLNQSNGNVDNTSDRFDLNRVALVGNVENFSAKFKWNYFKVDWQPLYYPKDGILKTVEAAIDDPSVKNVQIFVSGHGWSDWVKVKEGKITKALNYELTKDIVRIFIKDEKNRFNSTILTKGDVYVK